MPSPLKRPLVSRPEGGSCSCGRTSQRPLCCRPASIDMRKSALLLLFAAEQTRSKANPGA